MEITIQNLTKQFGALTAVDDVSLTVRDGEFLTLVGPSGCGKSTMLRCITGLETPTAGSILFDDRDVTDDPPQQRNVAMVFQNYALYPHMSARRNMTFALTDQGLAKAEIRTRVQETAEMLGIADQLDRRPEELSGGQKQRVALGRSLVRNPDVILMDEPLSNLDAKLRIELRAELQKIHQELGTTTIYVTHDQEEAMTMSDRLVVMNDGEVQQLSRPEDAYNRPTNRFVANFIGSPSMNFFGCESEDAHLQGGPVTVDRPADVSSSVAEIGVRPEDLVLDSDERNPTGRVSVFEHIGPFNIVYVDVDGRKQEVVAQVPASQYFDVGTPVSVEVVEDRFHLFTADGQAVYNPPAHGIAAGQQHSR